jgi:DNA-binding XRE family transcriptional regulator
MPTIKLDLDEVLKEKMKNAKFAEHYLKYRLEYELITEIVQIRKEKNVTQETLAQLSGVKQQVISRMERHQAFPNLTTLAKIANALGLQLTFKAINPN